MKPLQSLALVAVIFSTTPLTQAQQGIQTTDPQKPLTEAKENFVRNQNYLQQFSKDYKNSFGDSIKGFDERSARRTLLAHGLEGSELTNHLGVMERDYVNHKYKLGNYVPSAAISQPIYNQSSPAGKTIGGGNVVNVAPCVNEGFESTTPGSYNGAANATAINGWTISSLFNNGTCGLNTYSLGGTKVWVRATPVTGLPGLGTLGTSPLGGANVLQIHDNTTLLGSTGGYYVKTKVSQRIPVTQANTLFQFAFAGSYNDGSHNCCEQPALEIQLLSCNGQSVLACSSLSLNAQGANCPNGASGYTTSGGVSWTNWQVKYIDLTPYIGSCVTVEFINQDCIYGGHWGMTFIDALCGGQVIGTGIPSGTIVCFPWTPVSFCAGSNQAMIFAPVGYNTYQWYDPSGAIPQGTMSTLVITGPIPGTTYTCIMTSASGCQYYSTNTLNYSTVSIAAIGANTTCVNGNSGSAYVIGGGSGTGYNYLWTNSTGSVVGTASIVNNLPPGVYSVTLTGLGSAGCGSAVATTTIDTGPPVVTSLGKPFCGNVAFLQTPGGTNYRWYQGTTLLTGTVNALPTLTVNNPSNGAVYWVSYLSLQGCQDSTKFTLTQSPPGNVLIPTSQIKLICPGASNGTANIIITPAPGAPSGFNSYYVASTGSTPAYTASIYPSSSNNFTVGGLSGGNYTVIASDGSCNYYSSFFVPTLVWNYTVSPVTATLCPGNTVNPSLSFTSLPSSGQYTYAWSPSTWVPGSTNLHNILIVPNNVAQGSSQTTTYSVVVTPSAANCPITKTISITSVNPPTPTITPILPQCNTFPNHQIQATPGGGTFINSPLSANLIGTVSGIFTPSNALFGYNTFTYAIKVNTCVATRSGTFQLSQFHTAALTAAVPPLCVTHAPFNLMNIVQSAVNGSWSGPSGVAGGHFNPLGLTTGNYTIKYKTFSSPNPLTCPDSSALLVQVTETLIPTITPVHPFCNNHAPITMTVNPTGGGWSGPNISAAGIITPNNITQPGTSIVTYTVTSGPCLNSNTTSFQHLVYNTAALTTPALPELCHSSSPVNLMTFVQNTSGTWLPPLQAPQSVQSNSFNPAALTTSVYILTYKTVSTPTIYPPLCDETRTLAVSVLNPPAPTIVQVGPYCSKDAAVQLSVTPSTGNWVSSTFVSNSGVFTPSNAAVGNNAVQYVIGTPTCFAQNTKFVSVESFQPANITSNLPELCNTSPAINLVPFTLTNLGQWSGAGITGTSFNPALAGQGNHVLTHKTSSFPSGLCPDLSTVAITVYSLQTPVIKPIGPVCDNAMPVQLTPSPVGGIFGGVNTNGIDLKGLFVPASGTIGKNIVNYSITSGPCVAYAQATISVEKFVSAEFISQPPKFCRNSYPLNMNGYVLNQGGTWSGPGMIGNMFTPKNAQAGKNTIRYSTHSLPTATLCEDFREINVIVNEVPSVVAMATDGGCAPVEVVFNTPSANEGEGEWTFGDGSDPQKGLTVSHVFTSPGSYSVVFNYSYEGCRTQAEVKVPIQVYSVPQADFAMPVEILISKPLVQITNLTPNLGEQKYSWQVTDMEPLSEVHPILEFPKIGKYQVTLSARTEFGCKSEISRFLEVKNDFNIFIPSSFTPNFDGLNDLFLPVLTPYGVDQRSFEMQIFDRWGRLLYQTNDITKGWDGSYNNKGEPLKQDIYNYSIKYKDLDGNSYSKMGHVSVIK